MYLNEVILPDLRAGMEAMGGIAYTPLIAEKKTSDEVLKLVLGLKSRMSLAKPCDFTLNLTCAVSSPSLPEGISTLKISVICILPEVESFYYLIGMTFIGAHPYKVEFRFKPTEWACQPVIVLPTLPPPEFSVVEPVPGEPTLEAARAG